MEKLHKPEEAAAEKQVLTKIVSDIREKYRSLKNQEQTFERDVTKTFAPIVSPLQQIVKNTAITELSGDKLNSTQQTDKTEEFFDTEQVEDEASSSLPNLWSDPRNIDATYGIKPNDDLTGFVMGQTPVNVDLKNNTVNFGDANEYFLTKGLHRLLTKRVLSPDEYTEEDLRNYKDILVLTSAHLKKNGHLKSTVSRKYKDIVAPLFLSTTPQPSTSSKIPVLVKSSPAVSSTPSSPELSASANFLFPPETVSGEGYVWQPPVNSGVGVEYRYFDDPNELVQRLQLLHASINAGNTSLFIRNEVQAIIEELQEAGYIH
jgi:hypothetical protein